MAFTVMACSHTYIVMALVVGLYSHGIYHHGLYGPGLQSYVYSYGLVVMGLYSHRIYHHGLYSCGLQSCVYSYGLLLYVFKLWPRSCGQRSAQSSKPPQSTE